MKKFDDVPDEQLLDYICSGTDDRIYAIAELLRRGTDQGMIYDATKIDMLFIEKFKNFEALEDEILFNLVKIDAHGYGVYWNDYLDISCNELWHNGKEIDLKNIK